MGLVARRRGLKVEPGDFEVGHWGLEAWLRFIGRQETTPTGQEVWSIVLEAGRPGSRSLEIWRTTKPL